LSIGYDSSFYKDSITTFNFEIGAVYVGKSKIDISSKYLGVQNPNNAIDEINGDLNTQL
jgi:hypothetical protein